MDMDFFSSVPIKVLHMHGHKPPSKMMGVCVNEMVMQWMVKNFRCSMQAQTL